MVKRRESEQTRESRVTGGNDPYEFSRSREDDVFVLDIKHPVTGQPIRLTEAQYKELLNKSDILSGLNPDNLDKEVESSVEEVEEEDEEDITPEGQLRCDPIDALARSVKPVVSKMKGTLEKVHSPFPTIDGQIQVISRAKESNAKLNGRSAVYNWSVIRKDYVLGKRVQLGDGTWVNEDYTLKEIATKYGISYGYLSAKSASESWQKLRKAYLARVNSVNIGQELGLYTSESYQAEVSAMNACNKLSTVLNSYLEYKFGNILDNVEDLSKSEKDVVDENIQRQMDSVNPNTGNPTFITEVKEAVKVTTEIYKLQRQIYENSPAKDMEKLGEMIKGKPKFKSEKDRKNKLKELHTKLALVLNPDESIETKGVTEDDVYEISSTSVTL